MAMRAIAHEGMTALEAQATDGLLDYLQTLYRVAHAPVASHWCTPGHNRGRALGDERLVALATSVVPFPLREDER